MLKIKDEKGLCRIDFTKLMVQSKFKSDKENQKLMKESKFNETISINLFSKVCINVVCIHAHMI